MRLFKVLHVGICQLVVCVYPEFSLLEPSTSSSSPCLSMSYTAHMQVYVNGDNQCHVQLHAISYYKFLTRIMQERLLMNKYNELKQALSDQAPCVN